MLTPHADTHVHDPCLLSGWLKGEPCVDAWHGVTCCPETRPQLTANGLCAPEGNAAVADGRAPPVDPSLTFPDGCHSGSVTGNITLDAARCVPVKLDLASNGLTGEADLSILCRLSDLVELRLEGNPQLAGSVLATADKTSADKIHAGCLPRLRVLDATGDGLVGPLPSWLLEGQPDEAELMGNAFATPNAWRLDNVTLGASDGGYLQDVSSLVSLCRTGPTCNGLPPTSCAAFGSYYRIRTDDPTVCSYCDPALVVGSVIALLVFGLVSCGLLAAYVAVLKRYPEAITKWVSTFSLMFGHVQTLAVIANLQLEWPPQVKAVTGLMSL